MPCRRSSARDARRWRGWSTVTPSSGFGIEQELAGLPPEERCEQRLARSKPVMDALLTWAETKSAAVPKSALGKALYYLREQWPYLIRFLEDGRLEIFNNRAERSVKPFVMSRKN